MKVAKKSLLSRRTLTLTEPSFALIEQMRQDKPKSVFVESLLKAEAERRAERQFYAQAVAAYTPEVSEETFALNAEYPIHES